MHHFDMWQLSKSILLYLQCHCSLKVSSYSALFVVRCGALTHITLTFELEYDNAPHRTANNAEYVLTFMHSQKQNTELL